MLCCDICLLALLGLCEKKRKKNFVQIVICEAVIVLIGHHVLMGSDKHTVDLLFCTAQDLRFHRQALYLQPVLQTYSPNLGKEIDDDCRICLKKPSKYLMLSLGSHHPGSIASIFQVLVNCYEFCSITSCALVQLSEYCWQ